MFLIHNWLDLTIAVPGLVYSNNYWVSRKKCFFWITNVFLSVLSDKLFPLFNKMKLNYWFTLNRFTICFRFVAEFVKVFFWLWYGSLKYLICFRKKWAKSFSLEHIILLMYNYIQNHKLLAILSLPLPKAVFEPKKL